MTVFYDVFNQVRSGLSAETEAGQRITGGQKPDLTCYRETVALEKRGEQLVTGAVVREAFTKTSWLRAVGAPAPQQAEKPVIAPAAKNEGPKKSQ